ncbi:MAG: ATP-binding protein, partial [Gammaproteobacteria bacterium]
MISNLQQRILIGGLITAIMATAFAVDYFLSFSFVTGMLYAMAVVVSYFLHDKRALVVTVALCTLLVFLGYLLAPLVASEQDDPINKVMEIFTIWTAFWLSLRAESANQELLNAHEQLEQRILERTEELNFVKEELADAVSNARLGHWRYDETSSRFTLVSEEYAEIFGFSSDEFQQRFDSKDQIANSIHPEDLERVLAAYQGNDRVEIEYRILHKDGSTRWVHEIRLLTRDDSGALSESWGTLQDISELKKAQLASEAANQAKSRFMAIMNHELRTPLNGVIGMIELLKQSQMTVDQQDMLNTISESGESLLMIVNDILDYSKIESGKLNLEQISLSLVEVVEGSILALSEIATAKGLRLLSFIDPLLPDQVLGDPVRLRQILINLLGNALKFSEEGTIHIDLKLLDQDAEDHITVRLSVRDEGVGISEEAQGRLFEAFSQAEESTTRKFGGTGLGLVICRMLTELMGGTIGIISKLGEGTEFHLEIPFSTPDSTSRTDTAKTLRGVRTL